MNSNREKLFGDDPLSMMADVPAAVEKKKEASTEEETIFRQVDSSKISFKEKKALKGSATADSGGSVQSTDNKIAAAVWKSDLEKTGRGQPKVDTSKDLLMDLTGGAGSSAADDEEDLFGSSSATNSDLFGGNGGATGANKVHIRGEVEEAETSLNDLKVSAMLEREEDLDFGLFGKAKTEKPKPVITKKNADIFEMESDEYFNELEKVATRKEKDTSKSTIGTKAAPAEHDTAKVDIDVSSLDLNAYINAQSSSSGGGLFD